MISRFRHGKKDFPKRPTPLSYVRNFILFRACLLTNAGFNKNKYSQVLKDNYRQDEVANSLFMQGYQ